MERWTRLMIRWRWAVLAVWIVVLVFSFAAMAGLSDLLTNRFTLPGTDTERTEDILEDHFGQKSTGSFSIVARGAPGSAPGLVPEIQAAAERASAELPTSEVARVAAGLGRGRHRDDRLEARARRREGLHRRHARGDRRGARSRDLRQRPGGDRARSRPGLRARSHRRRVLHRDPDRAAHPRLRFRNARVPDPVHLRDRGDSRRHSGSSGSSLTSSS